MVISQQRHEMEALVGKICGGIGARSSLDGSLEGVDPDTIVSNGDWWIAHDSICDHKHDQGGRGYATCLRDLTILRNRKSSMRSDCLLWLSLCKDLLRKQSEMETTNRSILKRRRSCPLTFANCQPGRVSKMYSIVSAATSRSIDRKRILTQSRMTTRSWSMLPRMTIRSRILSRDTTRKYSSTTPGMRSCQKGGRYDTIRRVASVLRRTRDRLRKHLRGGIGLLCRQIRTRQLLALSAN
jgi:hypothetical protein